VRTTYVLRHIIVRGESVAGKTLVVGALVHELTESDFWWIPVKFTPEMTAEAGQWVVLRGFEMKPERFLRALCNKAGLLCIDQLNAGL
jgi:hypothetical protein